jgi:hypothetical protein
MRGSANALLAEVMMIEVQEHSERAVLKRCGAGARAAVGQRRSPVDDDVAGLTEGCESRSCQEMGMLTEKIERKKGGCVNLCERWISFCVGRCGSRRLSAIWKSLRLSLPDCDRYPRLRSMPQIFGVLDPFLVDWDLLHGHVGGVLVGGHRLWWRLAAAEVVGMQQRKEGGSYLEAVSGDHFSGISSTL